METRTVENLITELFLCILQDMSQYCVDPMGVVSLAPPPPPPPMPPPEESERPPKPPFADEEEEEEMMLREELLKSLANKRAVRAEVTRVFTCMRAYTVLGVFKSVF